VRGGNYSTSIEKKAGAEREKTMTIVGEGWFFLLPRVAACVCSRVVCVDGSERGRGSGTVRCTLYRKGLGSGCGNEYHVHMMSLLFLGRLLHCA
jgi:hypothetical protein